MRNIAGTLDLVGLQRRNKYDILNIWIRHERGSKFRRPTCKYLSKKASLECVKHI